MKRKLRAFIETVTGGLVSVALAGMMGCGYQFSGEGTFLPKDVHTLYIEPFINRSRDVGIDKEMTSALRSEFYRRGPLNVVDNLEEADAILNGVVHSLESRTVSTNRYAEVLQYESAMIVDVTLRRRQSDVVIWRGQGLRLTQLYNGQRGAVVTTSSAFQTGTLNSSDVQQLTDIQLTEGENSRARNQLIERFATELRQRLIEIF